jgi:hypothetical protein
METRKTTNHCQKYESLVEVTTQQIFCWVVFNFSLHDKRIFCMIGGIEWSDHFEKNGSSRDINDQSND